MALQVHRTALLPRRLLSLDTLTFLRAASTAGLAGTYPYNIPNNFAPPPYPYGPSIHYRRRDSGLYGATTIQHGNLVSEKNEHKSRRVWRPNVHNKKLWSNYLGRFVQVKVVTRVLRTIDKVGGLDEYLVGSDAPARIKELGVTGWALRWRVMQTQGYNERIAKERGALGLPGKGWLHEVEERKRVKRRDGIRVAEAYLEALKVEVEGGSRVVLESVEDKDEGASLNFMEENKVYAVEQQHAQRKVDEKFDPHTAEAEGRDHEGLEAYREESKEAQDSVESEFDIVEEQEESEGRTQNEATQSVAESIDPAMPGYPLRSSSEQLLTQLTAIAAQLRTTPDVFINMTRATIANRATQLATAADRKAELAAERDALVSEIDTILASSDIEPILKFHATHLAIARSENALHRERHGNFILNPKQIKLNVTGPPSNIPAHKWAELHARVKVIKADEPRRQQEAIDRRARQANIKQFLKEHREEIIVMSMKRRKNMSLFRRALYEFRWIKRSGLKARFQKFRTIELKPLWARIKALFRRRKPKPRVEEGTSSKA